jgi:hypothetical protein
MGRGEPGADPSTPNDNFKAILNPMKKGGLMASLFFRAGQMNSPLKFEARNPKFETSTNSKKSNDRNKIRDLTSLGH